MAASSDNGARGARQFLSWPIILEWMIAPPATAGIVALLTWWAHPILGEDTHWVASASALTPLGLLAYLVLQAIGLLGAMGWLFIRRLRAQRRLKGSSSTEAMSNPDEPLEDTR